MLTLILLRHAKSSWSDPTLQDFERPLADRGMAAAPRVGRFLAAERLTPDLILCSTALRTRQTLALALIDWKPTAPTIAYEDGLYLATPAAMRERLAAIGRDAPQVMLVGHNPGLHALALELVGDGPRKSIAAMAAKFPTGALAVIDFAILTDWSQLRSAAGKLRLYETPKSMN